MLYMHNTANKTLYVALCMLLVIGKHRQQTISQSPSSNFDDNIGDEIVSQS